MAQVKTGSDKPLKIQSTTIDGIQFSVNLFANAVNVPTISTDFSPEKISIRAVLKRAGMSDVVMINTNMQILAHVATMQRNRDKWLNGFDIISAAAATKAVKMKAFKYTFGSPLNLKGEDLLTVTVTVPDSGAYSSAIDTNTSYVEFKEVAAIGYETGVAVLETEAIEAATTSASFALGEDVNDIYILNFDKNSLENPVLNSVSLSSAFYDRSFSYRDLICNHYNLLPENIDERRGTTIPMAAGGTAGQVFPWLTPYPQSFWLHKGMRHESIVHAKIELSMNSDNVNPSKNYVVYKKIITNIGTIVKAHEMAEKHKDEALQRISARG